MKCSKCGSRAVETKPELYPGGVGVGYVRSHLPNEAQPFAER